MAVNVNDIIRKLGSLQRKKVEARAAKLIEDDLRLRLLRAAGDARAVNGQGKGNTKPVVTLAQALPKMPIKLLI